MNLPPSAHSAKASLFPLNSQDASYIKIQNLNLFYGKNQILENISLTIPRGEITAVVGPSGCGKTSLLSTLNRLTDFVPTCRISGTVFVGGRDIHASTTDVIQLRRRIGMIFQRPTPFPFSIRKNISFPLHEHGVKDQHERDHITESVLRDVGLWEEVKDRLDTRARALSGGQQQRLCIARALALKPETLLMDEPCAALDPMASGLVEDLISRLKDRYTILIVTHNLAQARRISDHTAFLWHQNGTGHLIEHGPTEHLFEAPKNTLTAAYINGRRG